MPRRWRRFGLKPWWWYRVRWQEWRGLILLGIGYCTCEDSTACACGGMSFAHPHCMWCCKELSPRVAAEWRREYEARLDEQELYQ